MDKPDQHLTLRQVELYVSTANYGSFAKAARAMGITPATCSQAVADLEKSLGGGKLFYREHRSRGVKLTPKGEAFLGPATRLLEAARDAQEAAAGGTLERGRLVVAYQPMLATTARAVLEAFLRRQPAVHVHAIEQPLRYIPKLLRNRATNRVDLALAYLPGRGADPTVLDQFREFGSETLSASSLWLVASRLRRINEEQGRVRLADIRKEPFALAWLTKGRGPKPFLVRRTIRQYLQANGAWPLGNVVFRSNRVSAVLAVVRAGLAVTILPTIDPREHENLVLYNLDPQPSSQHAIGLLWPQGPRSARAEAFAAEVRRRLGGGDRT
jgi:LysR family cyn operon transcriptional activator